MDPQLKDRLLDLAEEKLFKLGYRHLSVDKLAQAAGISKRTLYELFPSKRQIATQALERFIEQAKEAVAKCLKKNDDPVGRLRALVVFISQQLSWPEKPFFEDLPRSLPHIWVQFEGMRRSVILGLEATIAEGIKQGLFRVDLNQRVAVLALLGAVEAVGSPEVLTQNPFSAQEAVQSIWTIFLQGMLAEGQR